MTQNLSYSNSFPVHGRKGGSEKLSTAGTLSVNPGYTHYLLLKGPLTNLSPIPEGAPSKGSSYLQVGKPRPPAKVTAETAKGLSQCDWAISLTARELSAHLRPVSVAVFLPNLPDQICISLSQLSPFYPLITFLKTKVHYIILSPTYLITCKE